MLNGFRVFHKLFLLLHENRQYIESHSTIQHTIRQVVLEYKHMEIIMKLNLSPPQICRDRLLQHSLQSFLYSQHKYAHTLTDIICMTNNV